ncbi:TlpA family protein disulfide reductase [Aporhodopirellula aestuarii]|uniref:TlpA family protein disulfide reductase n=1 Tax=Aporhodopirellula aestuarii TaxID=2950107 RepID=A0ABT0UB81_9BACT|nr:TlpA disulfide reductase family protein [Aporhodopirellula aestuarii]MCM2374031.1 TlpA family protein disulfide reductase [Aporhodopirellula aestuarii]
MDRFLQTTHSCAMETYVLKTIAAVMVLTAVVGCGGGDRENTPPAAAGNVVAPVNAAAEGPVKTLTEGLLLPEDMVLPADNPADADASDANDDVKGLHLPDDIQPSVMVRPSDRGGVRLVSTKAQPAAIDLRYGTWDEINAEIGKTGAVTVVDFWSLACMPCLKEYPQLVALQQRYPDRVRAIGVNLDFDGRERYPAESYADRAQAFLKAVGATFPNYMSQTPSEEVFRSAKIASLPSVMVFDRDGKLAARFTENAAGSGFNYQNDIRPLVQKLLGESEKQE